MFRRRRAAHAARVCATQPCHVVYTDYRPTPLQHYMFPAGGDGLYLVVDADGVARAGAASATRPARLIRQRAGRGSAWQPSA